LASAPRFSRTSPEAEGIPSGAVAAFVTALERHDHPLEAVQGFMLLRHGNVAAEGWWAPYAPNTPHSLFSLSKSFTSTAIGLAVAEGLLTVDDPVLSFFPDDAPADPGDHLKAMTVKHLLSMNTGHHEDTTGRVWRGDDDNWVRAFLALPVEHEPGTWFVYNTAATYMLSAIITKLTGEILVDYLRPRLFDPLGIANPVWEADPQGRSIGGSGLHITLEDIAAFGQMYLQQGAWQGTQLLPWSWIAEATTAHSDNSNTQTNPDWMVGYGYQFWRCRHDAYRGDGAFGQYCVVMPGQDAVLVINSGLRDMQRVLDLAWEHLLPAMGADALPADPASHDALCEKLAGLSLPLPEGQPTSPNATEWSGTTWALDQNELGLETVAFTFGDGPATITMRDGSGEHPVAAGSGVWDTGTTSLRGKGDEPVAAAGAWMADDTFEVRACFTESETCLIYRARFAAAALQLELVPNVSWGPADVIAITGRPA